MNLENPHHELNDIIPKLEGCFIEELYYYFNSFKLDAEKCDEHEGVLLPSLDDIYDMQEGILELSKKRAIIIDKLIIS